MTDEEYVFDGFDELRTNYVQIPHVLIDDCVTRVRPSVAVLVLVTMRYTVGVLVHKDGSRKKEWITTMRHMMAATGIKSLNTAKLALWEGRYTGLLVYEVIDDPHEREMLIKKEGLHGVKDGQTLFALRPRWRDERIDRPETPRPGGSDLSIIDNNPVNN